MIAVRDIAWAAGFLEGEGCFYSFQTLRVSANQKQKEPLKRMQKLFGGSINQSHAKSTFGQFVWLVTGIRAAGVMMTIYLFMSPKRKQEIFTPLQEWKKAPGRGAHNRGNKPRTTSYSKP